MSENENRLAKYNKPGGAKKPPNTVTRRSLLKKSTIGLTSAAIVGAGGFEAWSQVIRPALRKTQATPPKRHNVPTTTEPAVFSTTMANGMPLPTATWVAKENSLQGSTGWMVIERKVIPHAIEGFASQVSAVQGDTISLYVNTVAPSFYVQAYRMGWYGGTGGRLIWTSQEIPGRQQPPPTFTPGINMVECHWEPSLSIDITAEWVPGVYLLKMIGADGQAQVTPITIRNDASTAAFLFMNSVTTWQAYNLWGGYSLYYGDTGNSKSFANRSRVVSFDRPYPWNWASGAADLIGNELPLLLLMEKNGLDVTYWTDIDLHTATPSQLTKHSALLSLGHDEYWSVQMRDNATAARDAGVNLAFFGANACFRRIRMGSSPIGPNRHQICYKVASEDPYYGVDNSLITANWPDPPDADPESSLIGDMYQSNPVLADLVVTNPSAWIYSGTELSQGAKLKGVVGSEYDRYDPQVKSPANLEIFAHSPLVCNGNPDHSDVTWYTAPSGAGVFASGTNLWIAKLVEASLIPPLLLPGTFPGVTGPLTTMTLNLLSAIGFGPAGRSYPSNPNWTQYY